LAKKRSTPSEIDLFEKYLENLRKHNTPQEFFELHDLENKFFWLFKLSEYLALANRKFTEVNEKYFEGRLERPSILFCKRATGGYYNYLRKEIGISLAMTVEFGEREFQETLLHEIAHIVVRKHNDTFYQVLRSIGGLGHKAPMTVLLSAKRKNYMLKNYPILVGCPSCGMQRRYKTRRALRYACKKCCTRFAGGKFDERFKLQEIVSMGLS